MTDHNDKPLTVTRTSDRSGSSGNRQAPTRSTTTIGWAGRRLRRKVRWVLTGLAIVYLIGTLGALRDCKHQLDHHTPQVVDSE